MTTDPEEAHLIRAVEALIAHQRARHQETHVSVVTVKPLTWLDHSAPYRRILHVRHDDHEVYQLMENPGRPDPWVLQCMVGTPWKTTYHATLEAAQAAAQEAWNAFIRSAIAAQ